MTSGPGRNGKSYPTRGHFSALRLAPLILSLSILAHPAVAQTAEAEKLGPLDTIELSVTGWSALRGGAAEAALLNNSFTIGSGGMLELPTIGKVQAAGLTEQDLAIADRRSPAGTQRISGARRRQSAPAAIGGRFDRS